MEDVQGHRISGEIILVLCKHAGHAAFARKRKTEQDHVPSEIFVNVNVNVC